MRKSIIVFICIILSIVLASCSTQTATVNNATNKNTSDIVTKSNTGEKDTSKSKDITEKKSETYNDHDIEKVILTISGQESESTNDEEIEGFLNNIKSCNDIPEAILINKIGIISVKYKNSDKKVEFADLYLASDNNVYAKYITENQTNYAYKIDIDKLGN